MEDKFGTRDSILDARNEGRRTRDKMRYLIFVVICFVVFCGWLVIESGLFQNLPHTKRCCIVLQQTTTSETQDTDEVPPPEIEHLVPVERTDLSADGGPVKSVTLGSVDPKSGFEFQLELSSIGAAIRKATFSGFDDRDYENPQPLTILSPVRRGPRFSGDGGEILTLANKQLVLVQQKQQFALDRLSWKSLGKEIAPDGSETAAFEVIIKDTGGQSILKLTKTYKVAVNSYLAECMLTVENLADTEQEVLFGLAGPVGIGREANRSDMRNVVGGYLSDDGKIVSSQKDLSVGFPMSLFAGNVGLKDSTRQYQKALQMRDQAKIEEAKRNLQIERNLPRTAKNAHFLWAATANKYFAAIIRPVPDEGQDYCEWVPDTLAWFYNPDSDQRGDSGDETIGVDLKVASATLAAKIGDQASKTYGFQLYLGPKDRDLFHKNELYKRLGFDQAITFMPCCCCPAIIIRPLAFGILATMKWMYTLFGNYGIVIIILVFLMRLALHPITKKSQVSMSKMSKLAPKAEEIKKKYANNKAEMNKQMMALYKEHGASPIMGMLPMMAQMPIWIALWSAVNASIDLRGAAFLPFWITDLSAPDALIRFSTVTIPLLGWKIESLNLLPILMGVAFYLQQKLTPSQPAASTSPQMAQQQKMMMIMLPVLFPLMFYKLASGVNLYIMTSTFAGVIEQHVIKKHIREKDEQEAKGLVAATSKTGGKVKKKKPKPFFRF